ncbi:hypothetical protein T484DRAFT_1889635, partial [Baffinella frigidus]
MSGRPKRSHKAPGKYRAGEYQLAPAPTRIVQATVGKKPSTEGSKPARSSSEWPGLETKRVKFVCEGRRELYLADEDETPVSIAQTLGIIAVETLLQLNKGVFPGLVGRSKFLPNTQVLVPPGTKAAFIAGRGLPAKPLSPSRKRGSSGLDFSEVLRGASKARAPLDRAGASTCSSATPERNPALRSQTMTPGSGGRLASSSASRSPPPSSNALRSPPSVTRASSMASPNMVGRNAHRGATRGSQDTETDDDSPQWRPPSHSEKPIFAHAHGPNKAVIPTKGPAR